ncbi:MAG: hypothetical protein H6519_06435 [Microthrixaceae bacterium]|nr:hypothetical protein [Acidimicrobiales bacterium]MCB9404058.1 hypothetical protein [Microthrixaceae bacterium]
MTPNTRSPGVIALVMAIVGLGAAMWAVGFAMPSGLGWAVGAVLVLLGGCVATSLASPNLAAVGVTPDDRLLVRPVGFMRFWALSRGIDVPVSSVSAVGVAERNAVRIGFRMPGTYLPGVMTAGTYRSHGEKDLWLVGRAPRVVVISLHDEAFTNVVVQVEDPEAAVEALRAAMHRER